MRVYVVGSVPRGARQEGQAQGSDNAAPDKQNFELSCYFASIGIEFVLGSIAPSTADFHVLAGVKEFLARGSQSVVPITMIMRDYVSAKSPDGQKELEEALPAKGVKLTKVPVQAGNNHSRLIEGIKHSDVVLLLGGGSGTFTTGVAALAMKHPTLALPQFGGAAAQTWNILAPYYVGGPLRRSEVEKLSSTWHSDLPEMTVMR